jgi:hypothetical protein
MASGTLIGYWFALFGVRFNWWTLIEQWTLKECLTIGHCRNYTLCASTNIHSRSRAATDFDGREGLNTAFLSACWKASSMRYLSNVLSR